jgi:hypothetical protein
MYAVDVGLSFVLAVFACGFRVHLLSGVSIILKNGSEKLQFLVEGILVTDSCDCESGKGGLVVSRMVI